VTTDQQGDSIWTGLLFSLLPTVLLVGAFLLVLNVGAIVGLLVIAYAVALAIYRRKFN
jgi:hypothetical protein